MSAAGEPDPKRIRPLPSPDTIDRLSALPEALMIHIISFLPTVRDKITTGALARKFQYLWTYVPKLYFNDGEDVYFENAERFVDIVNDTLLLCSGWNVKHFGVTMSYDDIFSPDIDRWIRFADRNKIQILELGFYRLYGHETEYYVLPEHLYSNSTFRKLRFSCCSLAIKHPVAWKSLKRLSLLGCEFHIEDLEMILAGTPALKSLDLFLVRDTYNLRFGNSGLKKLAVMMDQWDPNDVAIEAHLQISAPNVQSLKIAGTYHSCKLMDMTSLVEASLFNLYTKESSLTKESLSSLLNAQTLELGNWVIQGMTMLREEGDHPSLSKCKCLTVNTHIWMTNPSAFASLLKRSPGIETLTVSVSASNIKQLQWWSSAYGNRYTDEYWTSQDEASSYLKNLRTVKFVGFRAYSEVAFSLVKFLLKNAMGLQKMVFILGMKNSSARELFEISQKLSTLRRSSPCAELLVYE